MPQLQGFLSFSSIQHHLVHHYLQLYSQRQHHHHLLTAVSFLKILSALIITQTKACLNILMHCPLNFKMLFRTCGLFKCFLFLSSIKFLNFHELRANYSVQYRRSQTLLHALSHVLKPHTCYLLGQHASNLFLIAKIRRQELLTLMSIWQYTLQKVLQPSCNKVFWSHVNLSDSLILRYEVFLNQ